MGQASNQSNKPAPGINQHRKVLLGELRKYVIPATKDGTAVEEGSATIVLGVADLSPDRTGPIFPAPHSEVIYPSPAPTEYPDGMKPLRFPRIAFVMEGEADLRIGVSPAQRKASEPHECAYQIVSLRAGQAIAFPSGVPLDTLSCPHWQRADVEKAHSRIFWVVVLPDGMMLHTCVTNGPSHYKSAEFFAKDSGLWAFTQQLIEELKARHWQYEAVVNNCLAAILTLVERALSGERVYFQPEESPLSDAEGNAGSSAWHSKNSLARAQNFIEAHIQQPLTPQDIARHAGVSPAQLNRLFRQEKGNSVMRYVTAHRVQVAGNLLRDTQLPINEIAGLVGMPDHAIFHRTFKRIAGSSPSQYRKNHD